MTVLDRTDVYAMCPRCSCIVYLDGMVERMCESFPSLPCVLADDVESARIFAFRTNTGEVVVVDFEDKNLIDGYNWRVDKNGHVSALIEGKTVFIHRMVTHSTKDDPIIDHIHGEKRDNRKSQLRQATKAGNSQNRRKREGLSSRYNGVYYSQRESRWCASVQSKDEATGKRKNRHLGYYDSELAAAEAYNRVASALYGEFAKLNDLSEVSDNDHDRSTVVP